MLLQIIWLIPVILQKQSFGSLQYSRETMPGAQFYDGKKLNIPISMEAGFELFERWAHQGLSGIMSAVAKKCSEELNEYHRNKLYKCSRNAQNINEQARCVVQAIDAKKMSRRVTQSTASNHFNSLKSLLIRRKTLQRQPILLTITTDIIQRFTFRTKRDVVNRYNYKLMSEYETKTPFGILGKYLSRTINMIKKKDQSHSWAKMISKIKTLQTTIDDRMQIADIMQNRLKYSKHFNMSKVESSPLSAIMKNTHASKFEAKKIGKIIRIIRNAVKLAMEISGNKNISVENGSVSIGSPRLMSIIPREVKNEINMLSPTLLSLHDKGEGLEKLTSMPYLLKVVVGDEYDGWLNFIAEASGAMDSVDKIEKQISESEVPAPWASMPRGIDGQPLYFMKQNMSDFGSEHLENIKMFEKITKSLTTKQLEDFNSTGYSMLTREQIIQLYGPGSPYNNSVVLHQFLAIHPQSLHDRMIQAMRHLAKLDAETMRKRWKRQTILSPILLSSFIFDPAGVSAPIILSPVILTPLIFSPAIFGVVILSPWVFVPIILSPRLMSPAIVSPALLSTFILSPILMDPFILSPGLMIPYILSPKLLSPTVLSPSVMTPLVLNPFCLSPSILSPSAVTALVLSPFVLSPFVYSPTYISAILFSPSAFSPLINSTGSSVTNLFSPSIFS